MSKCVLSIIPFVFFVLMSCTAPEKKYNEHGIRVIQDLELKNETEPYSGLVELHYPSGKLHFLSTYNNGEPVKVESWYEDGSREYIKSGSVGSFSYEAWYPNGNPEKIENVKDGFLHGIQKEWYENGQLKVESEHDNNRVLKSTIYYEDGRVKSNR